MRPAALLPAALALAVALLPLVGGPRPALAQPAHAPVAGRMVLYTSQPDRDAAGTVVAFRKLHPGVEVEVFRSGTTEVLAKLAAEFAAGAPRPDALLIADAVSMEALKRDRRLAALPGVPVDGLREGSIDPERRYFGTKLITTGIVRNSAAPKTPARWSDLADPALKGQVALPSPLYSGAAAIMIGAFAARPDLGWGLIERLRANEAQAVRGNGAVLKAVAEGSKGYGAPGDFMAFTAKEKGSPIEFVVPEEGLPAVTEPVAVLETAANRPAAEAFVRFLLSPEGQRLASSQGYVPVLAGAPNPAWLPAGTQLRLMPLDLPGILATTDADKARFAALFGG